MTLLAIITNKSSLSGNDLNGSKGFQICSYPEGSWTRSLPMLMLQESTPKPFHEKILCTERLPLGISDSCYRYFPVGCHLPFSWKICFRSEMFPIYFPGQCLLFQMNHPHPFLSFLLNLNLLQSTLAFSQNKMHLITSVDLFCPLPRYPDD